MSVTVITITLDVSHCQRYNVDMGRWEPNARGRLEQAAMELYAERGYERTTVAEIAERAGLTERTFFRHFADKREVLFAGGSLLEDLLAQSIADVPESVPPIEATVIGFEAIGNVLEQRRDFARRRAQIIAANAELLERERLKLASMTAVLAATLRQRRVDETAASLIAEIGVAVFRIAFERWVEETNQQDLPTLIRESLDELVGLIAAHQ